MILYFTILDNILQKYPLIKPPMADSPGRLMIKDDNYNSCLLFCRGSSGSVALAVGGDDRPARSGTIGHRF